MRVDLHGLPLSEAKLKSQIAVAEAWESSQPSIELVHGHNLGTVIKDYVQRDPGIGFGKNLKQQLFVSRS